VRYAHVKPAEMEKPEVKIKGFSRKSHPIEKQPVTLAKSVTAR
jgi:hypothetical protein